MGKNNKWWIVCLGGLCLVMPLSSTPLDEFSQLEGRFKSLGREIAELETRVETLASGPAPAAPLRAWDAAARCDARLSLSPDEPVSTIDYYSEGNLRLIPYQGNVCSLYNGSNWVLYTITSPVLFVLGGQTSNTNYDVFLYDASGTLTMELTAWSSDTSRVFPLVLQDGIYVRTGDTSRRYLGTIRTTGTAATDDNISHRFVWNYLHRVPRFLHAGTIMGSPWTLNSTWRPADADTGISKRVDYVVGIASHPVSITVIASGRPPSGVSADVMLGVGVDSSGVNSALLFGKWGTGEFQNSLQSDYLGFPGEGYHFLQWLEQGRNVFQNESESGLFAEVEG